MDSVSSAHVVVCPGSHALIAHLTPVSVVCDSSADTFILLSARANVDSHVELLAVLVQNMLSERASWSLAVDFKLSDLHVGAPFS